MNIIQKRKLRIKKIIHVLKKLFPTANIALNFSNEFELAVAVILSAQTTDKQVNKVTDKLFKKYKKLSDYASAANRRRQGGASKFANDIKSIGLYKTKAKNILALAKIIKEKYQGRLPDNIDELVELPGIGRKTANVIMNVAHKNPVGVVVDTHVIRFSKRFDLSDYSDAPRIEKDLMQIVPKKYWAYITFALIEYGRQICPARIHECKDHPLTKIYPKAAKTWPKAK